MHLVGPIPAAVAGLAVFLPPSNEPCDLFHRMSNQDLPVGEIRDDKWYLAWSEPLLVSGAQGCPEPCIGSCGINRHRSGRIESTAILVTPVAQPLGWEAGELLLQVLELPLDGFITLTQMPYAIIGSFLKGASTPIVVATGGSCPSTPSGG